MKFKKWSREEIKKNLRSLKVELFFYFSMLVLIMIGLLWLFEVVFLDPTYKLIRTNQITKVGKQIVEELNSSSLERMVSTMTVEKDVTVIISDILSGETFSANVQEFTQNVSRADIWSIQQSMFNTSVGETVLLYLNQDGSNIVQNDNTLSMLSSYFTKKDSTKGLIYITSATTLDNRGILIMVYGSIAAVRATIETIREQLLIVTVIMLLAAALIALVASKAIADPIIKINQQTKRLSDGDYQIDLSSEKPSYTEINELTQSMRQLADDLDNVDKMQKELIANVSHDLRTPLTMISGYGEVMRDIPGENTPENVQVIIDEANRLSSLVNNLLDISKLQAKAVGLNLEIVNTNDLIRDVVNTYSKLMENKGYSIEVICDQNGYLIEADIQRLQQAMYNIINNAINHCGDDKEIIVSIERIDDNIRFEIRDHGPGIPNSELGLIWKRYYKVEKNHTRPTTGSGLGLSIVKTIFELHQAKYGVDSKVGEGTTFWFELPMIHQKDKEEI